MNDNPYASPKCNPVTVPVDLDCLGDTCKHAVWASGAAGVVLAKYYDHLPAISLPWHQNAIAMLLCSVMIGGGIYVQHRIRSLKKQPKEPPHDA